MMSILVIILMRYHTYADGLEGWLVAVGDYVAFCVRHVALLEL